MHADAQKYPSIFESSSSKEVCHKMKDADGVKEDEFEYQYDENENEVWPMATCISHVRTTDRCHRCF